MKGVSVIIPCFNAGAYLKEAVFSVHEGAPAIPYEVIIVNDASTDAETNKILQDIAEHDPKTRVFSMSKNSGQAAARNFAIENARYDIVFPLDADDKIRNVPGVSSFIDRIYREMQNQTHVPVTTTNYEQFGAISGPCHLYPFDPAKHLIKNLVSAFSAFRRADALDIGGYNPSLRFGEDWDFYVGLINHNHKRGLPTQTAHFNDLNVNYRTHDTGLNASVKERTPRANTIELMMDRSPEIYDHYHPGKTADELGSKKAMLLLAFDMAAEHPIAFARAMDPLVRRRFHSMFHRAPGQ